MEPKSLLQENAVRDPDRHYEPPGFEVISLDCEISSYAPDGDDTPLF